MFKNFLKTTWRNLKKRKVFSAINLFGLASGMAVCLLLALYINSELGFDRFHEKADQVYRLSVQRIYPGRTASLGEIPQSIGQAVKLEFPEVMESVRITGAGQKIQAGDKVFNAEKIYGADPNFFRVFSAIFIQGNANDALQKPNTAVVNESTAIRFFESAQQAMGKQINVNGTDCMINGVCKDWPPKSHFQFTVLKSNEGSGLDEPNYYDFAAYTYLLLNKNASAKALEAKLPLIVKKYVAPAIQKEFGESFEQFSKEGNGYNYFLQPLEKIHLYSNLEDELSPTSSINTIYLAATIGLFILLLACINFINLSTAVSVERAREIGVRKTFGSAKKMIIWQFLSESVLFSVISAGLSLLLTLSMLPLFNDITGSSFSFRDLFNAFSIYLIAGFALFIGIIAGLYPALILSSFKPIDVLKGRFKTASAGVALRNGLVVFQFSVAIILIVCTIVINSQVQLMLGNKLGFTKDNVVAVREINSLPNNGQAFINDLANINAVADWSMCAKLPNDESYNSCTFQSTETKMQRTDRTNFVDERYQRLLGLKLEQGRFFSKDYPTDSTALVLNEAAVKDFGLTHPIGSSITSTENYFNPAAGNSQTVYTVIGVVQDFNFESVHQQIAPLVLANANRFGSYTLAIKIEAGHLKEALPAIQNTWKRFDSRTGFNYSFLDAIVAAQYKAELTAQKIFTSFSVLAILIACTGLFGLVLYATFQRTKEIGVRKILGATAGNIVYLLSKDFIKLVLLASLIAFPIAWFATHLWLQGFAYRVYMSGWMFALSVVIITVIAFLTISFQSIKAAVASPVKSLRAE